MVIIIGAGAVGVNAALFLTKLGFEVHLLESAPDILQGAPLTSFINHGDGFEYYKSGHERTGQYCIDGALVKGLIYPLAAFATDVCSRANPIRFMVSRSSAGTNSLTLERFYDNAEHMRTHFTRQFESVLKATGWTSEEAKRAFLRDPRSFSRILDSSDFRDISHVVGGCAGSGFGINMPHYYAFLKAALRQSDLACHFNCEIEAIEKCGRHYVVAGNGFRLEADQVLIATGHHIPAVATKIRGVETARPRSGMYYLNHMTLLKLPATSDEDVLAAARRINFTLQQDHGSMFACVVPPTPSEDGLAATYYPSPHGSQLREHLFDPGDPSVPPSEWDHLINEGLPPDHPNVRATLRQACHLYPFLREYAEVSKTVCRAVFNADTPESDRGSDRRVREIPVLPNTLTADRQVSTWAAPKWTNAELLALMATDHVCAETRGQGLPKFRATHFGPSGLSVTEIMESLDFSSVRMRPEDAFCYAQMQGLPSKIVNTMSSLFEHS